MSPPPGSKRNNALNLIRVGGSRAYSLAHSDSEARVSRTVNHFSTKHGGPLFAPHCTLIPSTGKDLTATMEGAKKLASQLKRHYIRFEDVAFKDAYFQCVFLLCKQDKELMKARKMAESIYQISDQKYMPHMSLMYSDVNTETRIAAVSEAKERLYGAGNEEGKLINTGFWAESLEVWRVFPADKKLESWEKVGEFKLIE